LYAKTHDEIAIVQPVTLSNVGTQEVDVYTFTYRDLRVHLIDTPGFDDTDRKDTEVLRDIAGWLGTKKNLHMFQKLCGPDCLKNIFLATTFWDIVDETDGNEREQELIQTEQFWGYMWKNGSTVIRHNNSRQSAMAIIDAVIRARKRVTLVIQREMVKEGRDLDETSAGRQLNEDINKERQKHKREMKELQEEMQRAMQEQNQEAAQQIAQLQDELARKLEQGRAAQERLKADLETLQQEREAEFERIQKQLQEQAAALEKKHEEYKALEKSYRGDQSTMNSKLAQRDRELQTLKEQFEQTYNKMQSKKTGGFGPFYRTENCSDF
jgi:myosin heavy subunit